MNWRVFLASAVSAACSHPSLYVQIGKELLIDAVKNEDETVLNFREFQDREGARAQSMLLRSSNARWHLPHVTLSAGTLNDGKSAFCAFRFEQSFFDSVRFEEPDDGDPDPVRMAAALPLPALARLLRSVLGSSATGKGAGAAAKKVLRLRIALEDNSGIGELGCCRFCRCLVVWLRWPALSARVRTPQASASEHLTSFSSSRARLENAAATVTCKFEFLFMHPSLPLGFSPSTNGSDALPHTATTSKRSWRPCSTETRRRAWGRSRFS